MPASFPTLTSKHIYNLTHVLTTDDDDATSFLPSRWLNDEVSDEAKRVFHPFGAGSRMCLGMHLANMELRLATAEFFRSFRGVARLAPSVTPESMETENHFLVSPRSHKCEVWVH